MSDHGDNLKELLESLSEDELRELLDHLGDADDGEPDGDAAVQEASRRFATLLDGKGVAYRMLSEGLFGIPIGDGTGDPVIAHVIVHGGGGLQIRTNDLVSFVPERRPRALEVVSELNSEYRFAKFCIDDDNTVHAEQDVPSCDDALLDLVVDLCFIVARICRDARDRLREL